jgi:formate dehydrogenase alpha subunit
MSAAVELALHVDGDALAARPGETVLAAVRRAGFGERIPTLCFLEGSVPEGGCRLCLVEIEGRAQPAAACTIPAEAGMRVRTTTPAIDGLRRQILALLAARHPAAAHAAGGGAESGTFGALLARYGVRAPPAPGRTSQAPAPEHPYLRFDASRCIVCRRCLHACEDVQGQFVFAIAERGDSVRLTFGDDDRFATSACVSCGACVEVCPTGALSDVDRATRDDDGSPATRSVCGYCGVGCAIDVATARGRVTAVSGATDSPVNAGHLCAKGRYAHGWTRSADRLVAPLLRRGPGFEPVTWPEAMTWVAGRLLDIAGKHGPDALGLLTSSRSTNEAAYLLQKAFRGLLGTNNVDCCARVCHSSTALALSMATGTGAASASYADIERARTIVLAGANPTDAHPVVGARIKQAVRRGARLVVIDPRAIELSRYASVFLQVEPGTNVTLFNAMAAVLVEEELFDAQYVASRTEGFDALRATVAATPVAVAAARCGVPAESIREAARLVGTRGPVLFVSGLGLSELTQGTESVLALANLALLTGSVGLPGAGLLPLRGQNNVQGNADMGSSPDLLTGYQPVADPAVRARVAALWGLPVPTSPGLTIPQMLAGARAGRVRGLWIQGEDVAQSDPNQADVLAALRRLDLLVVQELFMSETARHAHLVLPAAGALEQDGTFTNGERRIQRVRRAAPPPGEAQPDWEIAVALGRALGADWTYTDPAAVMNEIAAVAPGLFGGVSYERLGRHGLQWPCPDATHPGTATLHAGRFVRGRGRLFALEHRASTERRDTDYPLLLITGRELHHYNVGTMTRRTPSIRLLAGDELHVHPDDAAAASLGDGDEARVESRHGRTCVRVRLDDSLRPGTLFLAFHFPESRTNSLTSGLTDPHSWCPEYKLTAARISPAGRGAAGRS